MNTTRRRFFLVAALVCLAGQAVGQGATAKDFDSDGIPDETELRLGADPNAAEKLQLVWESTLPTGAKERGPNYTPSRDIRKMFLGNVAGNRYLWALEFAADYEFANTNLTVFIDADNNPQYGQKQKDLAGTDFVLWLSDGGRGSHGYSKTGEGAGAPPTRIAMLGKRVYFCSDMNLAQEGGHCVCRALARCEVLEPRVEVSSTGWVTIAGPGESERAKTVIAAVGTRGLETKDSDGDAIPDSVEERLGTDPKTPERLDVIYDYAKASDAEARKKKLAASPERAIERILFGNVAGDRFLWAVEFGADYPATNSVFILYLDADNDPKTGRKDMPGVDYMLTVSEGNGGMTAFAPTGENVAGPPNRVAIVGKRLYLCSDLPPKQESGRSVYRATGLSQTRTPPKTADSTGWFEVKGAGISDRKKGFGLDDVAASENMAITRGLDLFGALKADPANAVVKIGNCTFEGFQDDLGSEYKEPSAIRTVPGGRIIATVPRNGRFHVGFLLYDQAGTERVEVRRGDERLGVAVADEDDNRTKLFFTKAPVDLKAGDPVELRSAMSGGNYRVEDILFLAKAPEVRPRVLELTDLEVTRVWDGDAVKPGVARVTWITTWPSKCAVKYEGGGQALELAEKEECANHRVYLENLKPNTAYQLRVVAPKPRGGEVTSGTIAFNTAPPGLQAALQRGTTPLTVQNPSSDRLTNWPVTSGLPFPKGALDSVAHIRLLGPNGAERPVQTRSLSRWPDGSVKWALVSFRADLPPTGSAVFTLEYGSAMRPSPAKSSLKVAPSGAGVEICTGPMRIVISRADGALPGGVWIDKDSDGRFTDNEMICGGKAGVATLVDDAGKEYSSLGPAEAVIVEENGPERACVLVKGHHAAKTGEKLFTYEARLLAYAGQPFVRLFYTFGNDATGSEFTSLRSLNMAFPLEGRAADFDMGAEPPFAGDAKRPAFLFQDSDEHYSIVWSGGKAEGKRARGWARVKGPRGAMTLAVRDFWRLYPKGLTAGPEGLTVGIMPWLKEDMYAEQAKDPAQLVHLYYYLLGGRYKIKQGVAKTHEMMISFDGDPMRHGLDAFRHDAMASAPSAWVCNSLALGEIAPTGTAWATRFDDQMVKGVANYMKARDTRRDYGMLNFGDWWGERGYNWANIEYDDAHVWLVEYARTGNMDAFSVGDRAAKHYADVDCIHYHSDPKRVGAGYSHCIGHVGGFFKTNPVVGGTLNGGHSPCHTRTEGLVEHYLLTGDRRSFDAALGIADRYDGWWLNNYDFTNCRVPGWHIVLTTALYNATADPFYLNAAKIIARRVIERESPGGGWRRCLVPGHCYCLPRHRGNAGFMVGVLLAGLKYYHQATGDPRAADALVRGARYLVRETYDPDLKQFRYTTCPNSSKPSSSGNMACEGFAYAARLTGAADLVALTRDVVSGIITRAAGGGASTVRFVPRALWDLDRMGPTPYGLAAQGEVEILALNDRGEDFVVEAEMRNGAGRLEVLSPSGKVIAVAPAPAETAAAGRIVVSVKANGEAGIYRIHVTGGAPATAEGPAVLAALTTSLDAEALRVGNGVRMKSGGLLKLEFSIPPAISEGASRTMGVRLKGHAEGDCAARLIGPDGEEAASLAWRGGKTSDWMLLRIPEAMQKAAGPLPPRVELKCPAGDVEVRLEGLPDYLSAPSGKYFCPAKPKAAFAPPGAARPGGRPVVALDGSRSVDVDNDIVEYVWKFDDGTTARGRQVTQEMRAAAPPPGPSAAGAERDELRAVTLEVRDKWGFTDSCTQTASVPPAGLLALEPGSVAVVEAEDFTGQGVGEVRFFERPGASGRMISYWHEVPGHWLEWKVNAPKSGEYRIILKYATQCDETLRDLKIDGVYPGEEFKKFHLPNTGGFCATKNDWAYYTIGGEKTPAGVCLAAGTHTIRMTNLKDGCALDLILLAPRGGGL